MMMGSPMLSSMQQQKRRELDYEKKKRNEG